VIYPIQPAAVLKEWPQAKPWLEQAFEHSEGDTAEAHLPALLSDQEQLWHIHGKAWALTAMYEGKRGRLFQCIALGGKEMDAWFPAFVDRAEHWAKEQGCKRVLVAGRPGWRKALPNYRTTHITLMKEL
jgi:hypothetical protein